MILKKLRRQKNWSQEQVATMSGLSIRTIQRIESGNRASIESLKSLAAVFEVDIETLQEEIIVIDKTTEEWKSLPWWLRLNFIGIRRRKDLLGLEFLCLFLGLAFWIGSYFKPQLLMFTPLLFLCAYLSAVLIRSGDEKDVW